MFRHSGMNNSINSVALEFGHIVINNSLVNLRPTGTTVRCIVDNSWRVDSKDGGHISLFIKKAEKKVFEYKS